MPGSASTVDHLNHHFTAILSNYKTTVKNHMNKKPLNKHEHEHEHKPMYKPQPPTLMPSTTMSTTTTMTTVTPTPLPMPVAASLLNDDYEYEYKAPHYYPTPPPQTYTPAHSYTPPYKPPPSYPTAYKSSPAYATTYPQKPQQYYDHSSEKIPLPTLFYPKKKEVPVYEEEEVFSSDDVLGKKVAPKGRNWCRNHNLICSVLYILGKSFW